MSEKAKKEFLNPDSNVEWAAQQIIHRFSAKQVKELAGYLSKLDQALYKSWAKEMTLPELLEAVKLAQ